MPIEEPEIYQQDAEFTRYQDALRWSRFNTAALLQAGLVYVLWAVRPQWIISVLVATGGLFLTVLLGLVAIKDEYDCQYHLDRIRKQEDKCPSCPFIRDPLFKVFKKEVNGKCIMRMAWIIICLFDVLLLITAVLDC